MTQPSISLEFFPPSGPKGEDRFWDVIDRLAVLKPKFVSVTYGAGGTTQDRSDRIVRRLQSETELKPAAHLTCVGATREDVDSIARAWWEAGIRHIVALRGDPAEGAESYVPHPGGYANAAELVAGLRQVADFEVSVGAYPEKHPQSPSVAADLDNLKRKLDAGAARAITQFFFEPEAFLRFRDKAVRSGITAPLVPGILPVVNFARVIEIAEICETAVPDWMHQLFEGLDEDPETRAMVSASITTDLCNRLRAEGVDHFHFYTLNRAPLTTAICRRLMTDDGIDDGYGSREAA
ncbi:MAG: methylenetetrahydrofolate reductase [NAD(P)H] [Rhodospirillaceae bacterium]|nr:methylenetetrahydrofolate reductase [NAD(P)H] [Rhodospirillaceae bacterium]MBT6137229.1 methylenetetrahydrofolate reductase [NAD(P)H] [Rhodospirillaceae bacterium]